MPQKYDIAKGVSLNFIPNERFSTTLASFNFYLPITKERISAFSLLSSILVTCSDEYKDFRLLNLELSRLYGADISSNITKVGDNICVSFKVSTIKDAFAFEGDTPVADAIKLLLKLIFEPKVVNGAFEECDIKRERRMLIENINGELNEKRMYAHKRLIEEMFDDSPYGYYRLGDIDEINNLDGKMLFKFWETLLNTATVSINVISEELPEGVFDSIKERFSCVDRSDVEDCNITLPPAFRNEVKYVTDRLDVAQGKLVMGFNGPFGDDETTVNAMVMADLFGGGPYSRLFTNVREKQSLCYYCACRINRTKGYLMVDSGIETDNLEKAIKEILNQLEIVKNGDFDDYEFEASKKGLCDSLMSANDSLGGIDSWYRLRGLQTKVFSPEELALRIKAVSKKDVIIAAQKISLNTVYMLLPKEEEKC